jgi:hypothetical protein
VLPAPLLQEYEHTQTTTSERFYVREVDQNHASVCLLCDSIAQLEGGITTYNSAFTLNDSHIPYFLDVHV